MRKRILLLSVFCITAMLLLQNCHDDCDNPEPDSNYTGTPDTIQRPRKFPPVEIPAGITLTKEGVQLGRMLFYDPVLSSDSTIACASCHKQEFAFADGGKALSTNVFGVLTKRNSPALFNLVWMKNYFWDGRVTALTEQAADALQHEQNFISVNAIPKLAANTTYVDLFNRAFGQPAGITEEKIQKALAMFMMKLVSAESRFDSVMRGQGVFTGEENHGFFNLFSKDTGETQGFGADCFHCHAASNSASNLTMIDNNFHNNALDAAASYTDFQDLGMGGFTGNAFDNGRFRTPHIRNIEVTGPYMHDGRFTTLQEVIEFYNSGLKQSITKDPQIKFAHQGGIQYLTQYDKDALVAFLKTLTDHRFLTDTAFSNPFK